MCWLRKIFPRSFGRLAVGFLPPNCQSKSTFQSVKTSFLLYSFLYLIFPSPFLSSFLKILFGSWSDSWRCLPQKIEILLLYRLLTLFHKCDGTLLKCGIMFSKFICHQSYPSSRTGQRLWNRIAVNAIFFYQDFSPQCARLQVQTNFNKTALIHLNFCI